MNNRLLTLVAATLLLSGVACRSHRKAALAPTMPAAQMAAQAARTDSTLLERAQAAQPTFDQLSLRGDLETNMTGTNVRAKYVMRIKRDSLLWMSVTGYGIEAVRLLATPDSVKVLNRLERKYEVYSFQEFAAKIKTPLTFKMLQSAMLGSPRGFDSLLLTSNSKTKDDTIFTSTRNNIAYRLALIPAVLRLRTFQAGQASAGWVAKAYYGTYRVVEGLVYPSLINLVLNDGKAGSEDHQAILTVDEVKRQSKQEYPFNVPARYTRERRQSHN